MFVSSASSSSSVYSTPGHKDEAREFIFGIYIGILPPLMPVEQFVCMAYMWHLKGMFATEIYMVVWCFLNWYVLYYGVYMYTTLTKQWDIHVQWDSHIWSVIYVKYMYSDREVEPWYTYMHTPIHTYMHKYRNFYMHTFMSTYMHTYTFMHICLHTYLHACIHT